MDLRLAKALGTTPGSWYAMQANYDMWQARRHFRARVRPITKRSADDCDAPCACVRTAGLPLVWTAPCYTLSTAR